MGVDSGVREEPWPPLGFHTWYKYERIADRGLIVLFFSLFSVVFPWKFFCRRPW